MSARVPECGCATVHLVHRAGSKVHLSTLAPPHLRTPALPHPRTLPSVAR